MACGVFPPGLVQSALADIASIISLAFSGSLLAARTCAAASMADNFFSFGALDFFAGFFLVVFAFFVLDMVYLLVCAGVATVARPVRATQLPRVSIHIQR